MDVVAEYQFTKKHRIDGGQGQNSLGVFCAFDPQVQAEVAVKEIDKASFPKPDDFFAEAQRMFRADHPNVVPVRVATQTSDRIMLVMPIFPNGSLASRIEVDPLPLADLLRVAQQVLAGLGAIHAAGTIHFDIKPSNILFSDRNVAMIADFGQAREIGPTGVTLMPQRMYAPGTPPETFTNARRGTAESDIYQLGLTLYRAANGEPMFEEQFQAARHDLPARIVKGQFPRRDLFAPHVPDRLRRIIRKALNVDPSKRFSSAAGFSNALVNVRIKNNWKTASRADGSADWIAVRKGQPRLEVSLLTSGSRWKIELHTCQPGSARRKFRQTSWHDGLGHAEAKIHLSQLFAALG
jgi:eukaryotic-like serine/threonine-protein kinase